MHVLAHEQYHSSSILMSWYHACITHSRKNVAAYMQYMLSESIPSGPQASMTTTIILIYCIDSTYNISVPFFELDFYRDNEQAFIRSRALYVWFIHGIFTIYKLKERLTWTVLQLPVVSFQ